MNSNLHFNPKTQKNSKIHKFSTENKENINYSLQFKEFKLLKTKLMDVSKTMKKCGINGFNHNLIFDLSD